MNSYFDINQFNDQLNSQLKSNKNSLSKERLSIIHPDINTKYNSLNVLCGPQGSGKTYTACKEIAKISQADPHSHLLIVIAKPENSDDPTLELFKPLIHIPIIVIPEAEAEDTLSKIFSYKRLYNTIKEQHLEDKIVDTQIHDLFSTLKIKNFDKTWLHTLVLINDSAKCSLLKPGSYLSGIIALGRHTQTSTYLNIQFWKGLTPEIKANISTAFIFGLYSRQQFVHILSQLPSEYDYKEIYQYYRTLNKNDKLIFRDGSVTLDT